MFNVATPLLADAQQQVSTDRPSSHPGEQHREGDETDEPDVIAFSKRDIERHHYSNYFISSGRRIACAVAKPPPVHPPPRFRTKDAPNAQTAQRNGRRSPNAIAASRSVNSTAKRGRTRR